MLATTVGEWAALVIAIFWAILVVVLAVLTLNFVKVVGSLKTLVDGITAETIPLLDELGNTVRGVNREIERIDGILVAGHKAAEHAATISETVKMAVSNPLVKAIASFAGARKAVGKFRGK
ncbi:MAG: hypothetical protein NVSMB57_12380 [Actinomycetota bacterium]